MNCADILVTNEAHLCTSCLLSLPKTDYHLKHENPLFVKLSHNSLMVNAFCFLFYNQGGVAQKLLHQVKYQNKPYLGTYLGELYGKELQLSGAVELDYDMVIPVPMHQRKKKRRGYNQSENIAEGLSESLQLPTVFDAVIKTEHTVSQTKMSKLERWQNVQNRFRVQKPLKLYRKKVLLVDDVITTGATISEICNELTKCEVEQTSVCSIASVIK